MLSCLGLWSCAVRRVRHDAKLYLRVLRHAVCTVDFVIRQLQPAVLLYLTSNTDVKLFLVCSEFCCASLPDSQTLAHIIDWHGCSTPAS
jgi:hypothetical protein